MEQTESPRLVRFVRAMRSWGVYHDEYVHVKEAAMSDDRKPLGKIDVHIGVQQGHEVPGYL